MNGPDPKRTARQIGKISRLRPTLAIVLGTGFHDVTRSVLVEKKVAYAKLHGFLPTGVNGHAGELILGTLAGTPVIVLCGRSHFYEGHSMERATFAIRVLAEFGVRDLLLSNAAGGINRAFRRGDFMMITDHINFMGCNPLCGPAMPGMTRFVDMTTPYDPGLRKLLNQAARGCEIKLRPGVYLAVSGPSYETPAEIRAFGRLGADAVGMSTVPETIVARQCGLTVAGISCITNQAAGIGGKNLSHSEVLETANQVKERAAALLSNFAKCYGENK